jgi:shikimate kinase
MEDPVCSLAVTNIYNHLVVCYQPSRRGRPRSPASLRLVRTILVTGMSGAGKSTALAELRRRGYGTVDTDEEGWSEWSDEDGGYVWREERIAELLTGDGDGPTLYVAGTVSNQGRFYPLFHAVVLLSAPADVLMSRIAARTTNPYGKVASERALVARDVAEAEPRLRATCTHEVDATLPVDRVVSRLIEIGLEPASS